MNQKAFLYARVLRNVLQGAPPPVADAALKRFAEFLAHRGELRYGPAILAELERQEVHARGGRIIRIESARRLPAGEWNMLKKSFRPQDAVTAVLNPELVAGIRITVDGDRELDFSFAARLSELFQESYAV